MENINEMGHSFTKEEILRWLNEQPINHHYTLEEITNIIDTLFPESPYVDHTDKYGHVYCCSSDCDVMLKYQIEYMYNCLFDLKHSNELLNSRNGLIPYKEIDEAIQTRQEAYNIMKEYVNGLWPDIVKEPKRAKNSLYKLIDGLPTIRETQRESQAFRNAINMGYMKLNIERNGYVWEGVSAWGKIAQFAYFVHKLYYNPTRPMPDSNTILGLINVPFKGKNPQNAYNQALNRYMETDWENNPPKWKDAIDVLIPK